MAMGVRHIRTSLYADGDGSQWIDAALSAGLEVLCVTYRSAEDRVLDAGCWPTVLWQIGNEPDPLTVSPVQAAALTKGGAIACGIGHGTPQAWIDTFLIAIGNQRPAFHIYGQPLSGTMQETMAQFPPSAWITEIGDKDANELAKSLRMIDGKKFPRVYVYDLYSPDDGMTLTPAHQQVLTQFIQGV